MGTLKDNNGHYHFWRFRILLIAGLLSLPVGCKKEAEAPAPEARQVRTVVIEKRDSASTVSLTGRIEAEDEVQLAFRISGRLRENNGKLGVRVEKGKLVARLESQNEENQLRTAAANLAAARAQLSQARSHFERMQTLFQQGWSTPSETGAIGVSTGFGGCPNYFVARHVQRVKRIGQTPTCRPLPYLSRPA